VGGKVRYLFVRYFFEGEEERGDGVRGSRLNLKATGGEPDALASPAWGLDLVNDQLPPAPRPALSPELSRSAGAFPGAPVLALRVGGLMFLKRDTGYGKRDKGFGVRG